MSVVITGISLIPIATMILTSVTLRRLTPVRETNIREQQGGFGPGRGCIDQIFTLRRVLGEHDSFRRATIAIFLDLKGAFDSVDRFRLIEVLQKKGMPQKYVGLIKAIYAQTINQVRVYGELAERFETQSGVR